MQPSSKSTWHFSAMRLSSKRLTSHVLALHKSRNTLASANCSSVDDHCCTLSLACGELLGSKGRGGRRLERRLQSPGRSLLVWGALLAGALLRVTHARVV